LLYYVYKISGLSTMLPELTLGNQPDGLGLARHAYEIECK